jgi:hypothetical protein
MSNHIISKEEVRINEQDKHFHFTINVCVSDELLKSMVKDEVRNVIKELAKPKDFSDDENEKNDDDGENEKNEKNEKKEKNEENEKKEKNEANEANEDDEEEDEVVKIIRKFNYSSEYLIKHKMISYEQVKKFWEEKVKMPLPKTFKEMMELLCDILNSEGEFIIDHIRDRKFIKKTSRIEYLVVSFF